MNTVPMTVPTTFPGLGGSTGTPFLPGGSSSAPLQSGSSSFGLGPVLGIAFDVIAILVLLVLVGIFVIVVVANRADPDPTGRRPIAVLSFAVSFFAVIAAVVGSTVVISGFVRLIGSHSDPVANSVARMVVLGGLITLASEALLWKHLRRGLELARADETPSNPSRRVGQSYVSAISFLMTFVLFVATILAAYLIFALIGPGVFGSFGGRTSALRVLLVVVYLGVAAAVVIRTHRGLVPPGLDPVRGAAPPAGPTATDPAPAPIPSGPSS